MVAKKNLFGNLKLLNEKTGIKDLLLFSSEADKITHHIDSLVRKNSHSVIAYLGGFGAGKTTILREIEQKRDRYQWVSFEIWRYTNRQEIWDGFVIKLASEILKKSEFKVADEIEGNDIWSLSDKFRLGFGLLVYVGLAFGAGWFVYTTFKGHAQIDMFVRAFFKYAAASVITLGALLGLGSYLRVKFVQVKRPLRRLFELEVFLNNTLKNLKKPLIIVVEDVDRTAFDGIVFLETLSNFIRVNSKNIKQPLIVIAPQTKLAFDSMNSGKNSDGFEQSLKIYDEHISFKSLISDESIDQFYNELDVAPEYSDEFKQITKVIMQAYLQNISIRLLKYVLREVDRFIDTYPDSSPTVAFVIILSKYIPPDLDPDGLSGAIRMIAGGSLYGSGHLGGLAKALEIVAGSYSDKSKRSGRFLIRFAPQNSELSLRRVKRPSGSIEEHFKIDDKYESLIK